MKKTVGSWAIGQIAALVVSLAVASTSVAEERDFTALAERIVNTSANVQPGDVVVVAGGKHNISLMEAITIEAAKAGGMPTMFLNTDRVERAVLTEVPEQYLGQQRQFMTEWIKHVDVWIRLPGLEDRAGTREGVSETKLATRRKGGQSLWNALNDMKERVIWMNLPSRVAAEKDGVDFAKLEEMHWASLEADYEAIAERGTKLHRLLRKAKQIRITTAAGTDFAATVRGRPVFLNDGVVSADDVERPFFLSQFITLPGGNVVFAPLEDSANGVVVVPEHRTRLGPLNGIKFNFKDGKIAEFTAKEGIEGFNQIMAARAGSKDVIASISIGLNPAAHVLKGTEVTIYPPYAAGAVWLEVGNNQLLGGKNTDRGTFRFPIRDATVTVDGKVVVQNGKLTI
jgi:leucyl aminopeptidase (aminopeptidase T)